MLFIENLYFVIKNTKKCLSTFDELYFVHISQNPFNVKVVHSFTKEKKNTKWNCHKNINIVTLLNSWKLAFCIMLKINIQLNIYFQRWVFKKETFNIFLRNMRSWNHFFLKSLQFILERKVTTTVCHFPEEHQNIQKIFKVQATFIIIIFC